MVSDEDAPSGEFSTQRAYEHLRVIAAEPHPTGSPANVRVRRYLLSQLMDMQGLEISDEPVEVEDGLILRNVAVRLRGSASTGAVLIGAHYDSVPEAAGCG